MTIELADPLCVIEGCEKPARPSGLCSPCECLAEAGGHDPETEAQFESLVQMLKGSS